MNEKHAKVFGLLGCGLLCLSLVASVPLVSAQQGQEEYIQDQLDQSVSIPGESSPNEEATTTERKAQGDQPKTDAQQPESRYSEVHFLATDTLIGLAIRNTKGETVGKVYDLLVAGQENRAPMVVASFGGLLGLGDSLYAIPWDQIKHDHEGDVCVLSIPNVPEKVSSAPPVWVPLEESYSDEEPKFGLTPYGLKMNEEGQAATAPAGTSHLVSANELFEKVIKGSDPVEGFETLDGMILGSELGHLVCAIVSVKVQTHEVSDREPLASRFPDPGVGEVGIPVEPAFTYKLVAVPMMLLHLDESSMIYTASISQKEIAGAPTFDRREREMEGIDREWVGSVYAHFGKDLNLIGGEIPGEIGTSPL